MIGAIHPRTCLPNAMTVLRISLTRRLIDKCCIALHSLTSILLHVRKQQDRQ